MNFLDHIGLLGASVRKFLNNSSVHINRRFEKPYRVIKGTGAVDDKLIRKAQKILDNVVVKFGSYEINAQIFWANLYPAICFIGGVSKQIAKAKNRAVKAKKPFSQEVIKQFEFLGTVCEQFAPSAKTLDDIWSDTQRDLYHFLITETSLESGVYSYIIDNGRSHITVSHDVKAKTFDLPDGHRVGHAVAMAGRSSIQWMKINIEQVGPKMELPVYAQRHVVERMIDRLDLEDRPQGFAYYLLGSAFKKPVIYKYDTSWDTFLVECKCQNSRVGYFVCQIIGNAVLVNTFLFITMDGTPEGRNVQRVLRLRRQDKEYLGLDHIATFLRSDMQSDAYLVNLMKECGCGHLFDLKAKTQSFRSNINIAEEMRRYLRVRPQKTTDRDTDELARALETS
ncbi:MAG: hypothetical protein WC919_02755 [Candidatus Paceibacterota bacterium]|jgi:hypothetical protein